MAPSTPKNQRKRLSNAEKQEIIEDSLKSGFCRKKTMEKFRIGRNVLSNILKNQKEMLATFDSIQTNSKAKYLKA